MLVALNAFFVAGEFAIVSVERGSVERRAQSGERTAVRILRSLQNLSFELSGAQLGITVTSLVLGAVAEPTIAAVIDPLISGIPFLEGASTTAISVTVAFVIATLSQMVFGELVPKNLAIAKPYRSAVWFGIPMQMVNRVLRPLILFLNNSADWTLRRIGIEPRGELAGVRSMEELELMVRSSGEGGQLDDLEMKLLTRAITFTEKAANDAMIPRVHVVAMSRHTPVSEMLRVSEETGHSRFPVFDSDLDDVVGVVHVKDTLDVPIARQSLTTVAELTQPALEVPESSPLQYVLEQLRSNGRGMAIVVDEYGGTAGIVTIEDLLEEIFGEIADEHDTELPPVPQVEAGGIISGLLHRHEVEELTGFEWPDGRYETLGGFVIANLGRFPEEGEITVVDGYVIEVVEMDGLRVDQVRVTPIDESEATP